MEKKELTTAYLRNRIKKGMKMDTYSAELQSWAENGKAKITESKDTTGKNGSADIIGVSDSYLVVVSNGKEVTRVNTFTKKKQAEKFVQSL